jgi:glyoxylase-like metal-dependent hydrolase (beta-lactamase superfamily II)
MSVQRITRIGVVNAYLVEEDDGLTLIDTLIPGSAKKLLAAAGDRRIARVLLTHAHQDHIGSLDSLVADLDRAEVLISEREARLLRRDMSLDPDEPQAKISGGYSGANTVPTRTLAPGDRVGSLQAIDARGHTPGQLAFLDTRDGTLYCGDAFSSIGGVATTARPHPAFPFPGMATWHRPTALESARRLLDAGTTRLAPGHGKVVESARAAMEQAIAKAAAKAS